jgi:ABC-2 type transport system ATP-binding protein
MSRAVDIDRLTKTYGSLTAVDGISFSVEEGEMFCLVGPDGAGKTTTLRMLCGLLPPTSGGGSVLGCDLRTQTSKLQRKIGYLSQKFSLYGDLTVDENIEFFAEINEVFDFRARRDELLAFTRLEPFRDRLAEQLSGGMKQKLALACTLVHQPKIIFLDEPTTGVDPVSRRDFWKILSDLLHRNITIVMSTPYLDEAERCSRVALMHRGRLMVVDEPRAVKALMHGAIFEVVCDRIRDAAALLAGAPGVTDVQVFGDRLNVVVGGEDAAPPLLAALAGAGVAVADSRFIHPTLENVFISMTAHEEEDRG